MSILKTRWSTPLILALALLLRLLFLGLKPPHFDEGVNGWFVDQMTKNGYFHYDPANYHGPLHFYVLFLSQTLFGRSIWSLRVPIVLVSVATIYLMMLFDRFLGRPASQLAALALAVSPAAVFYSRYAIHESWLVFFLILTLFGGLGLWKYGAKSYLWGVTYGLTGLVLTKETYILHVTAFLLAGLFLWFWEKLSPSADDSPPTAQQWTRRDVVICSVTALALILFFYSGTLLDFKSLRGLYQTYAAWFQTGAQGHGHEKPFYYWVYPLMARYEALALVGILGSLYLLWPRQNRWLRYIAIYGCGTLTAYSLIHYKTPWCIISLLWPFFFVYASLATKWSETWPRLSHLITSLLLAMSLGWTIWLNFFHYTDEKEPYVYVQTLDDIFKLTRPLQQLTQANPENYHLSAHILVSSYHPLPWLLGDFTGIGYYGDDRKPDQYDGDFLLVEESRVKEAEKALHESYFTEPLQLRASQDPSKLYLNVRRFGSLFPNRVPDIQHQPVSGSTPAK